MEMTTIVDAVKDSGAIDVEEEEQDHDSPANVQEGNCDGPHLQTGETTTDIAAGVAKDSRTIDAILDPGHEEQHGNNQVEVQEDKCSEDQYINTKCHQGTQTDVSTISSIADAVVHKPEEETNY